MVRTFIGLVMLALATLAAHAQDEFPDITGTWETVSGEVITHEGQILSLTQMPQSEVVIETQQGPLFRGFYRWKHPEGTTLDDGRATTNESEETFLGVFAQNRSEFALADTPDTGYWFGELVETDVMVLRYLESGPYAAAGYSVMRRLRP